VSDALALIDAWFADRPELDIEPFGETGRFVVLHGERKRTIPVQLEVGDHTLTVTSFFLHAPDEQGEDVYAFLLRRNLRSYIWRFALNPDGDVLLVGVLPRAALSRDELDRMLGQLLSVADDAFTSALRLGFSTYIEREQAWRAKVGAPRNPIT
jgi:hypothetical protein